MEAYEGPTEASMRGLGDDPPGKLDFLPASEARTNLIVVQSFSCSID
jgi:hypothetical protein